MQSFFHSLRQGGWRIMALWLISFAIPAATQAQCLCGVDSIPTAPGGTDRLSCLGQAHTPHGHLHVLMIYIRYTNTDKGDPSWSSAWPDSDTLPDIARDDLPGGPNIPGVTDLFTADTTTLLANIGYPNISQYYYRMSDGKFLLTGDVYEQQVPVMWTGDFRQMEQAAIDWIVANDTSFDWGKYDNRTNMSNGAGNEFSWDNSQSPGDSVLDYVAFVHRRGLGRRGVAFTRNYNMGSTGFSTQWVHSITTAGTNLKDSREVFIHELAHNLYAATHTMGANHTMSTKFTASLGWGMIAPAVPVFQTANAWERWYLGWLEVDSIYQDTTVRLYDYMSSDTSLTRALMIPVPNASGQMLWLENHQLNQSWDQKGRYDGPDFSSLEQGIYGFVSNKDMSDRSRPALTTSNSMFANGLRAIHADGQYDYYLSSDTARRVPFATNFLALERDSTYLQPNPFSGSHPMIELVFETSGNQTIYRNTSFNGVSLGNLEDRLQVYREYIGGIDSNSYAASGDVRMAFQTGDELGLSGNHPVVPVLTFSSLNQKNTAIPINGLSVEIGNYYPDGSYDLHVRFGEYEVSGTQRWCGDLILPDLDGDTLHLHQGDSILLDLSGTPDRTTLDPVTGTFANPTRLTLDSASHMHLAEDSRLIVRNHSTLVLKKGSLLEIEDGAVLRIEETGSLIMESGSHILVHDGGEVGILVGGYYRYEDSAQLTLTDDPSCIRIRGEWVIDTSATFTFAGDGFVSLALPNLTAYPDSNVFCRPGAGIRLRGSGPTDKILETDPNSTVNLSSGARLFALENGRVELGQNASLILDEADTTRFHQVDITCKSAPHRFDQVWVVNGDQVEAYQADFQYGQVGLSLYQTSTTPGPVIGIDQSSFSGCDIGLATQRVAVDIEASLFQNNSSNGWRHYSGTGTNYAQNSSFSYNGSDGIRYEGEFLDINQVEANENGENGILIKPGSLKAECSELNSNGSAGVFSAFGGGVQLTHSEARYNDVNILLDRVESLLLKNGFNRLWPANGFYLISGTLQVPTGVTTLDATHNQWASSLGVSPVYGIQYVLTNASSGSPIKIFDYAPNVAACAPGGGGGSSSMLAMGGLPSHPGSISSLSTMSPSPGFQSALQLMRTSNPTGNDLKAVVAWLGHLQSSSLPTSEQRAAHQLLMRAYYAAHTHQDFSTVSNPDSVHLALLSFLQDGLTHSAHYQDSLTFALDQVKVLYTLGDHASALAEISAALPWAQDEAQERLSEWQCLIQGEQNLEAGLLTVSDFHAWRNHCDGASLALRRAAPEKDVLSLPAGLDFQLDLYPNPAQNQVSIKWEQVEPGPLRLQIFSPIGKVIEEIYHSNYLKAGTYIFSLNLAGWKAGMYLVTSQTAKQHLTQKLLVWD